MKKKLNNKRKMRTVTIGGLEWYNFDDLLAEQLKDKTFRQAYEREQERREIARHIRETRMAKKLTQQAVAKKAAMPQSVIARLERGKVGVSFNTLSRVAHALGKRVEIV